MEYLDRILETLEEKEWKSFDYVRERLEIDEERFKRGIEFLENMGAIEVKWDKKKAKIKRLGSDVLDLPEE
jgi:predicted ArsR family transcriptional regulator